MAYYPCLDNTATATFQLECGLNEKTPLQTSQRMTTSSNIRSGSRILLEFEWP